jgi:hypothetical protein
LIEWNTVINTNLTLLNKSNIYTNTDFKCTIDKLTGENKNLMYEIITKVRGMLKTIKAELFPTPTPTIFPANYV